MSGALTPSGTMIATPLGMAAQTPLTDADILTQQRKSYDLYGMRNQRLLSFRYFFTFSFFLNLS